MSSLHMNLRKAASSEGFQRDTLLLEAVRGRAAPGVPTEVADQLASLLAITVDKSRSLRSKPVEASVLSRFTLPTG